jgi:CreA protein
MRSMVEGASGMRAPVRTTRRARELRRAMTLPEVVLWQALRKGQLARLRFRRQHPIGPYILDFYCAAACLAVEVDGLAHDAAVQIQHDERRRDWLAERGVRVLRVAASDVLRDERLAGVLAAIEDAGGTASASLRSAPPPRSGGGTRLCAAIAMIICAAVASSAWADDIACVSTTFRILGANDKVCISAFDDPKVAGVACDISQARTGGVKGSLGLAEDPSRFSLACRQVGPVSTDLAKLPDEESVYSDRTSIFFKHTHVYRIVDKKRNTLIYLAISDKLIEGSPQNAISSVPIMPWGH